MGYNADGDQRRAAGDGDDDAGAEEELKRAASLTIGPPLRIAAGKGDEEFASDFFLSSSVNLN